MPQKKILITRIIPDIAFNKLTQDGHDVEVWQGVGPMPQDQLIEKAKSVNALLSLGADKIDKHFFSQCVAVTSYLSSLASALRNGFSDASELACAFFYTQP